jgi:hypothetical protein
MKNNKNDLVKRIEALEKRVAEIERWHSSE